MGSWYAKPIKPSHDCFFFLLLLRFQLLVFAYLYLVPASTGRSKLFTPDSSKDMLHFLLYTSQLDAVCWIRILKICGIFRVFNFSPNKKNCCLSSFGEIRVKQVAPNVGKDAILGSYGLESLCYLQKLRGFSDLKNSGFFLCKNVFVEPRSRACQANTQIPNEGNVEPISLWVFGVLFLGHVFVGWVVPPNLNVWILCSSNWILSPNFSGENEKNVWNHHLACFFGGVGEEGKSGHFRRNQNKMFWRREHLNFFLALIWPNHSGKWKMSNNHY